MGYKAQLQNADGTPNWSLAPEGATHYTPETDDVYESFLRVDKAGDLVWFANVNFGLDSWTPDFITGVAEVEESPVVVART
jgi:hypothetical protein